ncbi:MAG: sulfate ABC transporter substrate-binding protein [bacterium]
MKSSCIRFRTLLVLSSLFIVMATGFSGCGGSSRKGELRLLNVSYDPTREFYREYNQLFAEHWKEVKGQTVTIEQSHGGSGKQARSVIDGLEADVVTLATASDIDAIAARTDLLPVQWQSRLPENSCPYYSTMVFVVRKGNPKNIHDWSDLIRDDVQVITPNPKTSGAARWSYLAAWSWAASAYSGDTTRILSYMEAFYKNVPVLDSGARGASNTFTQTGIGDVLINWENEAFLLVQDVGEDKYELVVPSVSILAEPPVALIDANADRHGVREIADEYLKYLYSADAQKLAGRHHYRPRSPEAFALFSKKFPELKLITINEFGGWTKAQVEHFNDNGFFDSIMAVVQGRKR